jgi:LCP family protein required for cell wall assembly
MKKKRSWIKITVAAVSSVLLVATGIIGFNLWQLNQALRSSAIEVTDTQGEPYEPPTFAEIDGALNILVIGSDDREGQGSSYGDSDRVLADVIILVHVAESRENAVAISFPRDLLVPAPDCVPEGTFLPYGDLVQINHTLDYGGPNCVLQAVQQVTELEIPHLGVIDFRGVIMMSRALGGVEVCVAEPINDPYTDTYLDAGTHTLEGKEALQFLRTRYGVGDGSDLSRISNQQVFLTSMIRKIKDENVLTNPVRLYSLATAAAENMQLSEALTDLDTMVAMARTLNDVDLGSISFVSLPIVVLEDEFFGRVGIDQEKTDELFGLISSGTPFAVNSGELVVKTEQSADPSDDSASSSSSSADEIQGVTAEESVCSN